MQALFEKPLIGLSYCLADAVIGGFVQGNPCRQHPDRDMPYGQPNPKVAPSFHSASLKTDFVPLKAAGFQTVKVPTRALVQFDLGLC